MRSILVILSGFIVSQSFAQNLQLNMDRLKEYLDKSKQQPGFSPEVFKRQPSPLLLKKSMFDTAKYSHSTAQGNVFLMPQDGMPCVKPANNNLIHAMPNNILKSNQNQVNQMPNAYTGKPLLLIAPGFKKQLLREDKK